MPRAGDARLVGACGDDEGSEVSFPDEAVLVVSGTVVVPTGGFVLSIAPGSLMRLEPPVQQVILRTTPPRAWRRRRSPSSG
jgi:hypothetical protein